VWLTYEKIRPIFYFSSFFHFFMVFFYVCFFFIFFWKCISSSNHHVKIPIMSTFQLIKNGRAGVLSTMSSIYSMSSIFTEFEQHRYQKNSEKRKPKKWATLNPSLDFGFPNHELYFKLFYLVWTKWFSLQNDVVWAKSQFDLSLSFILV